MLCKLMTIDRSFISVYNSVQMFFFYINAVNIYSTQNEYFNLVKTEQFFSELI